MTDVVYLYNFLRALRYLQEGNYFKATDKGNDSGYQGEEPNTDKGEGPSKRVRLS